MENLPLEMEPRTWADYVYQRQPVRWLQQFLRRDSHPNALLIEGPSGVGKTALAKLYVRATHCERRLPGQVDPCGECASCRRNLVWAPVTQDVVWLQKGGEVTIEQQIKQALELRYQPTYRGDLPHRDIRFIVADEIQSYGSHVLEQLLQVEWGTAARTVFIFITMQAERIDATLYQALRDRCFPLELLPIPASEIAGYLLSLWPNMSPTAASIVAEAAGGSIRHALSYMRLLQLEAKDVTGRGITAVHAYTALNLATGAVRQRLWELLADEGCTLRQLRQFYQELRSQVLELRLARQLIQDIDRQAAEQGRLTAEQLWARHLLLQVGQGVIGLWDVLVYCKGKRLVERVSDDDERGRVV